MTKEEIAGALERIATLLELKNENPFKIRAYTNAARAGSFQVGQIAAEAETLRSDLAAHSSAVQVDLAGSYRRRKEIVHDLDLLVATKNPGDVTKFFVSHPLVESIIAQGPTKSSVRLRSGVQCDLRVVSTTEYPFALAYFTGNKEHNIELRSRAL